LRQSVVLLLATVLVFGACVTASFHFDDYGILSDPIITSPSGWWQAWGPLQTRPLTWFTFWLNYQLGGGNPAGYHAVNLALHLCAVFLLFLALRDLVPHRAAFIAAAIFALHPIQAESVLYVFARGTLLATVFCLLALRSWIKERRWIAVLWFTLALLSKEECAAFPAFLLLWGSVRKQIYPILAMFGLALAAGLRVIHATSVLQGAGAGFQAGITPLHYLARQGWVILRYLRLLVLPWGFNVDPGITPVFWQQLAGWLILLGIAALVIRRKPGLWFLGGLILLIPSSSIFPAADLAADRRMYLPMIAFAAAAGFFLSRANTRILVPAGLLLAVLSFGRTQVWQSEELLWSEAVRLSPRKVRPRIQLARTVPPRQALELLEEASELGKMYMAAGDPAQALAEFGRELALSPGSPGALNNRGAALLALGQEDAARQDFQRALAKDPCFFDARFNLRRLGAPTLAPPGCRYTPQQTKLLE
jgi:hypothetical protein